MPATKPYCIDPRPIELRVWLSEKDSVIRAFECPQDYINKLSAGLSVVRVSYTVRN